MYAGFSGFLSKDLDVDVPFTTVLTLEVVVELTEVAHVAEQGLPVGL